MTHITVILLFHSRVVSPKLSVYIRGPQSLVYIRTELINGEILISAGIVVYTSMLI